MQVQVDQVKAHVARTDQAHQGVHVGSVVVQQASRLVHQGRDLLDAGHEKPQGAGIGQHQAGHGGIEVGPERFQVHSSLGVGGNRDHLKARQRCTGRVGAMGGVGHQDPGSLLSLVLEIAADHEQRRDLAVSSRRRLQGDGLHPRDLGQAILQGVHQGQRPLCRRLGLEGMDGRESGKGGSLLVDPRVVLHRARTQGVEVGIHREVELREAREVAQDIQFGQLGQGRGGLAKHRRRKEFLWLNLRAVRLRRHGPPAPGTGLLEEGRFTRLHRVTSTGACTRASNSSASPSTSWRRVNSVQQTRRPSANSG